MADTRPPRADEPSVAERAVEALMFAPFELTARVIEELPRVYRRTCERLQTARAVGELAVRMGTEEIKRQVADGRRTASSAPVASSDAGSPVTEPVGVPADDALGEPAPEPVDHETTVVADELALPDYDHLPAAQIVAKLDALSVDERDLIEQYELAHRHRRTVLGKLDQLRQAG